METGGAGDKAGAEEDAGGYLPVGGYCADDAVARNWATQEEVVRVDVAGGGAGNAAGTRAGGPSEVNGGGEGEGAGGKEDGRGESWGGRDEGGHDERQFARAGEGRQIAGGSLKLA